MKYYGRIARVGALWAVLREGGMELIAIPSTMVMARLLSPQEFGIAAAAMFFVQLADRVIALGFNAALIRVKNLTSDHTSSIFVLSASLGLLGWALVSAGAPAMGRFFDSPEVASVLPVAALSFVVSGLNSVPSSLLARDMRFRDKSAADFVGYVVFYASAILLALNSFGFWSLVLGNLAGLTVSTVGVFYLTRWKPTLRISPEAVRELFSFGIGVYFKRLLEYSAHNLDNLLVGRLLGMTALGLYDKAFSTMNRAVGRINRIGPEVSYPILAAIHDDIERMRRAYRKVMVTASIVAYPVLGCLIGVAHPLFLVLFGAQWGEAVRPFQVLCAAGAFKVMNGVASTATQAKGLIWPEVWRQALHVAMIVGGVVAFSRWGVSGAAFGVFVATAAMSLLMSTMVLRAANLTLSDIVQPQIPGTACAVLVLVTTTGVAFLMEQTVGPIPPLILLVVQMVAAAATYAAFVWFSRSPELRDLVDTTVAALPVKRWWKPGRVDSSAVDV